MTAFVRLLRDRRAASATEFALVLPLLFMLMFGLIDAGRFMWVYNEAEKATQMGVRYAVATDMIPGAGFVNYSFAIADGVPQGSPVPTSEFDNIVCDEDACTCTGGDVCGTVALNSAAFQDLVVRMRAMSGAVRAANVEVEYRNIGLGYAGYPNGPDVAPLVTVSLRDLQFQPLTCMFFLCDVGMPTFRAALTLEDGAGDRSN